MHAYALSYFDDATEGLGRLAGLLVLFAGAMLGVVLADDLIVLYGFWELTSVTSFLLIGNQYRLAKARAAAPHLKAAVQLRKPQPMFGIS